MVGTLYVYSQSEVDAFCDEYDAVESGSTVYIEGSDISDLSSFSCLTYSMDISTLYIYDTSLENLNGLEWIHSAADVYIYENEYLSSLSGLEELTSISGELQITNNASITTLSGLESLTSIGSSLDILSNEALINLSGLEALETVAQSININNNMQRYYIYTGIYPYVVQPEWKLSD